MNQEVLKKFDMPWLPMSALIIFFVCFVVYTWWTYKKGNKEFYNKVSMIPLEEAASEK